MSYSKNKVTSIQTLIQNFFLERLIQQRGVTSRTIESYRDTFKIYIKYFILNFNNDFYNATNRKINNTFFVKKVYIKIAFQ